MIWMEDIGEYAHISVTGAIKSVQFQYGINMGLTSLKVDS